MAVDDEIQSLKRRKLELSTDIDSYSCDMSILVKSNAMHKACKEKTAEMTRAGQAVGRQAS